MRVGREGEGDLECGDHDRYCIINCINFINETASHILRNQHDGDKRKNVNYFNYCNNFLENYQIKAKSYT